MFTAHRIHRTAILGVLVCALLMPAASAVAAGRSKQDRAIVSARAQERYYSSYGDPAPLSLPQVAAAPSDDGTPWLPIALSVAAAAAIVAASAVGVRQLRLRTS